MRYRVLRVPVFSVFCLLAICLWGGLMAHAMDVSDKGDPALSVSSTPAPATNSAATGDPALSVSSNPGHVTNKGDPALSVSSTPAAPALDATACRSLIKHTPDADVAYQPGVDVHGKPVAPADLPGGTQIQLPKTITIPLTLQLVKVLNLDTTKYPYNQFGNSTEAQLGVLTVTGDHVLFNGKPLSDEQQSNLAVLCMKADGK